MGVEQINRVSRVVLVVLALTALLTVVTGLISPPQIPWPDEGTRAHIFQLSMGGLLPMTIIIISTAEWRHPWKSVRPLGHVSDRDGTCLCWPEVPGAFPLEAPTLGSRLVTFRMRLAAALRRAHREKHVRDGLQPTNAIRRSFSVFADSIPRRPWIDVHLRAWPRRGARCCPSDRARRTAGARHGAASGAGTVPRNPKMENQLNDTGDQLKIEM